MPNLVFGHDGRGNYLGVSLVDVVDDKSIPFSGILTKESEIDPKKLEGVQDYGLGFLNTSDRSKALEYLGITEEMLEPGSGKEGPQGPIGPEGPPGPIGPAGLTWKGSFDATVDYVKDDAVGYNGASYYCIKETKGNDPSNEENCAFLASVGARGPQGPQGPIGPNGKPGTDGKDGKDGTDGKDGSPGVFDINSLSQDDLRSLYNKLKLLYPKRYWVERLEFDTRGSS